MITTTTWTTRVHDNDDTMDDDGNDKRQRLDNVNPLDDMYAYLSGTPVVHDDVPQQMFSCFANTKYYKESDVAVLAAFLKGVDITQMSSPERVTKVCKKNHRVPDYSFDLRIGYDLSDENMQALVMDKIDKSRPALVIGSPPCTMFSRLQQLNLRVHRDAWRPKFEIEE